jgi:SAM-dependent methyltransferase
MPARGFNGVPLIESCRLCGEAGALFASRVDVTLFRCVACGFVFGIPSTREPTEELYRNYYRDTPPPAPEYRYHEWLSRAEASVGVGRLLEIGAGSGAFVRVGLQRGWQVDATEVSETGLRRLRETAARIFDGSVEDAGYADDQFDFVVSLEVLEHLRDPRDHLRELSRITRPQGLLLLTTPNFGGLSRRWLGVQWRVIDPGHLCYFTPRTLTRALQAAGYRGVEIRSRSLDISTWRSGIGRIDGGCFDPHGAARLRDAVQSRPGLRLAKDMMNRLLSATSLGDSLLVWASR